MPLLNNSTFTVPYYFTNKHAQTLLGAMLRKVNGVIYKRERIATSDGDFLDLDWSVNGSKRLAIIGHGLEGNTQRPYMLGMAKSMNDIGVDALTWNFRSCGGDMNLKEIFYHGASTWDLETVIAHALEQGKYDEIYLIGFSIGGNLLMRYLGEFADRIPVEIKKAIGISVPCNLISSAGRLKEKENVVYMWRFLSEFKRKLALKAKLNPGFFKDYDLTLAEKVNTLWEFDDAFTAPVHGFKDASEMYIKTSCDTFLEKIKIPSLILNAIDDPVLGKECFPVQTAHTSAHLYLEQTPLGGHIGFYGNEGYYAELRAQEWVNIS